MDIKLIKLLTTVLFICLSMVDSFAQKQYEQLAEIDSLLNKADTTIINYYDNGHIKRIEYKSDSLGEVYINFYESYKIESLIYIDTNGTNIHKTFCENGNVMYSYSFVDTLVLSKSFYCNGQVSAKGYWVPSRASYYGKWVSYYENGQIKVIGSYLPYNEETKDLVYTHKKIGIWYYFKEDGMLEKKESYDTQGHLLEVDEYINENESDSNSN